MTNWIKKLFQNQAIRYIFFGGCTTLVNLVSYAAFRHFLGIDITVANFLSISSVSYTHLTLPTKRIV